MNDAHYHLLVNHFPIIGTTIGLGILLAGLVLKKKSLQTTAFVLFIIAAIASFLSMYTGDGAEDLVEDMPSIGHRIIHEHEELAEKFTLVMYALGLFSILSIFLQIKKHPFAKFSTYVVLALSIVAAFLGKEVGTSGGEIRHTEIRTTETSSQSQSQEASEKDSD